jgi:glycosyltransferase involved in cell wall biosynthesis
MSRIILTVTTDLVYDQRMQRIAGSLQTAGYDVLLVGRKKTNSLPIETTSFRQIRLKCVAQGGKFFYLEYNLRLFFFLLFARADILTAIDLDSILPVTIVGKIKRQIRVYDAHEYFTEVPEVTRRPRIQQLWEKVARFAIPRMDACYTVGPGLAEIFAREYGKPFGVVRNVPLRRDLPEQTAQPGLIFYQGALNEGRGLEVMLEAMQLLPPNFQFWLAGEGDLSEKLRERSRKLGLGDRVKFLGFQRPETLSDLTPQAWLGINLLENTGLSYFYSLANKAFDYTRAKVPSLQMAFPEYEALQAEWQCFILLPDLDSERIAREIVQLWESPQRYAELQANCARAAKEWVWEKEEERLLQIYRKLAAPPAKI